MIKAIDRFWAIFDKTITVLMTLAAALVIFDALAITIDVLMRYFFSLNFVELLEITEYSLLWMTFLGTAWILKNNAHVRSEVLIDRLKPRPKAFLNSVASVISAMLLVSMVWFSAKLTLGDYQADTFIQGGILRVLKWPIEIIIPIGFLLLAIQAGRNAHTYMANFKSLSKEQQMAVEDGKPGGES